MKIISKFQDYYDSALGSFVESDVVFERKSGITTLPVSKPQYATLGEDFDSHIASYNSYLKTHPYLLESCMASPRDLYVIWLGFCGKYYPMVTPSGTVAEIVWNQYDHNADLLKRFEIFFDPCANLWIEHSDFETVKRYSDSFYDFELNLGFKIKNQKIQDKYKYPGMADFWKDEAFVRFGPVFAMIYPIYGKYTKGSPNIFVFRNPCLKMLKFQKVMDPFMALYTINEWLDSHARPDDAVVPVGDDLTRLKAYGFDPKTSFRKAKEK